MVGIISAFYVILDNHGVFRCDAICVEDPVDTILAGFSGKSMMGTARCVVKGIVKGDAQISLGGQFIHEYPVMRRIKGSIEITHENGGDRVGALSETFHDEPGAECLSIRRKIEMGIDAGQLA